MDQVDEVKSKIDIVALIGEHVSIKKAGRNYKGLCPFHSEKTPSFMVSPELQIYKCFGCGEAGDALSFLEKYEGMEFYEALKFLAEKVGVKLKSIRGEQVGEKERLYNVNFVTSLFYNYILLNHNAGKEALKYLTRERGLKLSTIKKFMLGYSPNRFGVLENYLTRKKGFSRADLVRSGTFYQGRSGLSDRFMGRVIFPIFDHRGNLTAFAGRILPGAKETLAKYINSPETAIYHKSGNLYGLHLTKQAIRESKEAVVVEGELDLIASWQAGVRNVVAIKGSALTPDHVKLLKRFTPSLILALDSDFSGDVAARRGILNAQEEEIDVKVCSLPKDYKDPDEIARKAPDLYKKVIKESINIWDFYIKSTFSKNDSDSGDGKTKISREIVPILASIQDKIVQAHYISVVSKKLGVPVEAVEEQVVTRPIPKSEKKTEQEKALGKSRREILELRLMSLYFQSDPKILMGSGIRGFINTRVNTKIIEKLEEYLKVGNKYNPSDFSKFLPKELLDAFGNIMLSEEIQEEADNEKEIKIVLRELMILDKKSQLEKLAQLMKEYEAQKEGDELGRVRKDFVKISKELTGLEENGLSGIIL